MSFLDPPSGPCANCGERPATMVWTTSVNAANHGDYAYWCDLCAVTEQLQFARERRDAIPELEARYAELLGTPATKEAQDAE